MINTHDGRRFTDDVYATKAQVQAIFNRKEISATWDNVISYRKNFYLETPLKDTNGNNYGICLTRKVMTDSYTLQMKLMNDLIDFSNLSKASQDSFLLKRKNLALTAVLKFQGTDLPSNDFLSRISLNEIESIPSQYFVIDSYSKAYNMNFFLNGLNLESLEKINKKIIGSLENDPINYRNREPNDVINPLLIPNLQNIPDYLKDLFSLLNQEEIPLLLRSLIIIYAFDFIKPFEVFYEGTAALFAKNFLSYSGLRTAGFLLDFESIAFSRSKAFYSITKESEKTLDLTYFINSVLPYLMKDEVNLHFDIENAKKEFENNIQVSEEKQIDENQDIVLTENNNFALPVFPTSTKNETIEDTAKKLREVYPQLKRKEAHFYAGHCTIGLNYTIDQFRNEEKTVYETARTSMDDLAERGFYRKEKLKNKFVYSPIPMKED